ncbi:hypothetical protein RHMOL_Rhmol10G0298100 [Rhododendron molle]|uniref:Uncharacterized protein n=1 Tax=Rhododendron molle TaxID=49168 RepID=A0ACC0M7F5_RHOML|nr:hypothetical protein RHMOL_Rhmol10G0298100 [Rhododendron molle]
MKASKVVAWHGRTNAVCKCNAMQLKENKPFSQSVVAVAKNSTEAMKDSRVLDYAHMMSTLQYRKLDFEEFCVAAISVH